MADTETLPETEQHIQRIAAELTRMRDAANLLQSAEDKAAAVISAAQRVVQASGRFSTECGTIVARLADSDLQQKIDALQTVHQEVAAVKFDLAERLLDMQEEIRQGVRKAAADTGVTVKEAAERSHQEFIHLAGMIDQRAEALNEEISRFTEQLTSFQCECAAFAKGAKARSLAILVFVILGFFTSLGWLVAQILLPTQ
jgi:hypothetical protein